MKQDTFWGCTIFALGFVGFLIIGTILGGWALSVLWGWFIAPIFGLPQLTILQAIGVALVINFLTRASWKSYDSKEWSETMTDLVSSSIVLPVFTVLLGWVILKFM